MKQKAISQYLTLLSIYNISVQQSKRPKYIREAYFTLIGAAAILEAMDIQCDLPDAGEFAGDVFIEHKYYVWDFAENKLVESCVV